MTTSLRSVLETKLGWTWRDAVGTSVIVNRNRLSFGREMPDGGDPGQADAVWHLEQHVLAQDESILLPLDALEQTLFGDTILIPMSRVKAILVVNRNTSGDAYLLVGGAAFNEWSEPFGTFGDTVRVMPDSPLLLSHLRDGWQVGPAGSVLRIVALDGPVTFDIAILGVLDPGTASTSSG